VHLFGTSMVVEVAAVVVGLLFLVVLVTLVE
jgi:hypothetical protein